MSQLMRMGWPDGELPRIFDRFYRGAGPVRRPGSGLGLAIVSGIAAAHGGMVRAAANHPRGLRVTLTLPAAAVSPDRELARHAG